MLNRSSVVSASRDQISSDLGEEAVILNLRSSIYYGLDDVGVRVWDLVQAPRRVGELVGLIVGEYEVEPERCERDLVVLLGDLAAAGLVEIIDDERHA